MDKKQKIFVAGHKGLVGSNIVKALIAQGYENIVTVDRAEVDLTNENQVAAFFEKSKPEFVFLAAAKVGGIIANSKFPVDFLEINMRIQNNVIAQSYRNGAKKLLFLGSSCIYPKLSAQPMKAEYLLTGALEPTNEWYAIAKISGIKMCQAYREQFGFNAISVVPTSAYGPGDNFDLQNSHVLPALIRKFVEAKETGAKEVVIWGSGSPKREALYVEDLADACIFLMNNFDSPEVINIGTGSDFSISELAQAIQNTVGYEGNLIFDTSKPDGSPRKLLETSRIDELGWKSKTSLQEGLKKTVEWYLANRI